MAYGGWKKGGGATIKPTGNFGKPAQPSFGNRPAQPGNRPVQPGNRPVQPGNRPAQPGNRPAQPTFGNRPAQPGNRPAQPAFGNKPVQPSNFHKPAQPAGAPIRPGQARPAQPANSAPSGGGGKTPVFTVTSSSRNPELGVQTLVGDFAEIGSNHGRKYYQKVQSIPGHANVKVFLYYWDMRDGADFSGWWFGDQLGGSEVWARCGSHGTTPPTAGWKVPWDAPKAEPGLLTVSPYRGGGGASSRESSPMAGKGVARIGTTVAASGAGKIAPSGARPQAAAVAPATDARVRKATNQVDNVERSAKGVIARATPLTNKSDPQVLKKTQDSLAEEQKKLQAAQTTLTQDINEARKGGPTAVTITTELSKLSPRLRNMSTSLATELNKVRGFIANPPKPVLSPEAQKKLEEKHAKELKETLPAVQEATTTACDAVEAVGTMAAPLLEDPEDAPPSSAMDEIEKAASEAQNKLNAARQTINTKMQAARNYSPEARKTALAEFTSLQQKIGEAQKQVTPYKTFKKDFTQRVAAKKALKDIVEKLDEAELEVEKASMMSIGADQGSQMSEEDVKSAEELITPAQAALAKVGGLVNAKLSAATGPMRDELTSLKARLMDSQKKIAGIAGILKRQQEGLSLQGVFATGQEKVDKAEESMTKCGDAELSFLKGIEVLPADESEKAISESEKAAAEAHVLVSQARTFLSSKLQEVKQYSPETVKSATAELTELQKRVNEVSKRLTQFKSDTQERKVTAAIAECMDSVNAAEVKGHAVTEAAKLFSSENLDNVSVEALKEAGDKVAAADKECATALTEARKVIQDKQKVSSKDRDLMQGLTKLQTRVSVVQGEAGKAKKAAAMGGQLVKGKEVATDAETKITEAEAEVEKLVKISKPDDDGLGIEKIADESILEMEKSAATTSKNLRAVSVLMQQHMSTGAPAIKATLTKLTERTKKALTKIDAAKAGTKDQRERVLSENYAKEGLGKTNEMEATLEKMAAAELPYLKGIEVLPLEESKAAMTAADEASAAVQAAISAARTFIATKNMEMKKFTASNAKASLDEFVKLTERVNSTAQKLSTFKKDTEARKKKALLQEAAEKVTDVQAEAEKVTEAMKPIMEKDADSLSPEEASATVKALEDIEKSAQAKVSACRTFLAQRAVDAKGDVDNTKLVQELQTKLSGAQAELAKAKKLSSNHNQKLLGKAMIQEAGETVKAMEAEMEKAKAACAPLLEEKCERFLVKVSISVMCAALGSHMEENKLSEEDMFKKMGSPLNQAAFVGFVAKMPEEFKREECSFSEERRVAMFKSADADGDGSLSIDEFKAMFTTRHICVHGVSVTDLFDIAKSKTVCKLEVGDIVEGHGGVKTNEDKVPRLQCKIVASGLEGWLTTQGNVGTKYLDTVTPFKEFTKGLQATLESIAKSNNKNTTFFTMKRKELAAAGKDSPLLPAKEEVAKLQLKATELSTAFQNLRQKVEHAKREYPALEVKEKNAHIHAKEQKQADEILAPAKAPIAAVEAELVKLEAAAKPLTERQGTDLLQVFATPLSVQDEVKAHDATLKTLVQEAKTVLKAQQELTAKSMTGPMLEAKKDLQKLLHKSSQALLSCNKVVASVKFCCTSIANAKFQLTATTMRAQMQSQGVALDDQFAKLAPDGERISEDAFVSYVQGLKDLNLSNEHAKLLARKIEVGGIGRRAFMRLLQQYYKVAESIAITPVFDIVDSKEKPVRRADVGEIVEVVEGPKLDEKSGLNRVKVKALKDGAEGWISVKGNQGKIFLAETEKPLYACVHDAVLEKEFKSDKENLVRTLKAEEVLELLEGPRQEVLGSVVRLKGKASSDGKVGWFTMKDQNGTEFAEQGGKFYSCTTTVAITDSFDIKECKVLRKLLVGEVFVVSEGPTNDDSGVSRVKGKSTKDDMEGWITIKGNAGTTYAKVTDKLYTIKKDVPMHIGFSSNSKESIRTLVAEEGVEVLEGPREEKFQPVNRMKVRASSDRAVGWVTMKGDSFRSWKSTYKSLKAASLYTSKGLKEAVARETAVAELFDVLEGPVDVAGDMWVKVQAKKDAVVGWAPLKNDDGTRLLVQA